MDRHADAGDDDDDRNAVIKRIRRNMLCLVCSPLSLRPM